MALNISVAVLSILYVPMLYYLKDMHDYQAYEEEEPGTYNSLKKKQKIYYYLINKGLSINFLRFLTPPSYFSPIVY